MPYVNNTNFRRYLITIKKLVNGVVDEAYTVTKSLLDAIPNTSYTQITSQTLGRLSNADYTARLNAFYTYLENQYSYFNRIIVPTSGNGTPNGTDAVSCPIATPTAKNVLFKSQLYTGGAPTGPTGAKSKLTYGTETIYVDTAGQAPGQVNFDNTGQNVVITVLFFEYGNNVNGRLQIKKDGITIHDEYKGTDETYSLGLDVNSDYEIVCHIYNNY